MMLPKLLTALVFAGLLCLPAAAEELPEEEPFRAAPVLQIDNTHIYEHMPQSYAEGYEPLVAGDYAIVVLPLCCEDEEKPKALRISLLPEPDSPFIVKNYAQTVPLAMHADTAGAEHEVYLAEFWLAMHGDRVNGAYPVTMEVENAGVYTVYVNITNGTDPNVGEPAPLPETTPPEEPVILMPKVLVQDTDGGDLQAGETAELHITLKNTSRTEALQNFTVTAAAPAFFHLESTDTLYFEYVPANAEFEAVFRCQAAADAPAGNYLLPLQFDFAYGKGMNGCGTGNARMTVTQPVMLTFPAVSIPAEAVVSDRLELHIQAVNTGIPAAQNVRAELQCEGLLPDGIAFLGTVGGGTAAESVLGVQVSSKNSTELYGETAGTITFRYTDENGAEQTQVQKFSMVLRSPFSERTSVPVQNPPKYWLGTMTGIGAGILLLAGYLFLRRRKQGNP